MATKKRGLSKGLESLLSGNMAGVLAPTRPKQPKEPEKNNVKSPAKPKVSGANRSGRIGFAERALQRGQVLTEKEKLSADDSLTNYKKTKPKSRTAEAAGKAKALVNDLDLNPANHVSYKLVGQLRPGRYQPRRSISDEELEPLADSIKQQGLLQPVVVREVKRGAYEILAGERRWRACKKAGLSEVPVIVKDVSDQDALAIGIIENIQRENLNPLDEAKALARLCEEFALSHQKVATLVGKSRAVVTNLLRILNLTPEVKLMLVLGELEVKPAVLILVVEAIIKMRTLKEE